ncbi:hypothetical protein C443_02037 [Haloarcula argentinensis DSM 12282]|nr:hypothetical protein C443_02037 [Haloarcula argentinensis DSM 12282]
MFKGFYPPALPMYIPQVPLDIALEVVAGAHLTAIPVVAYWCARRDLDIAHAAPYALIWLFIAWPHYSGGQLEKLFAFPWVVLTVHQLLPRYLNSASRRAGVIAGIGIGAAFLAGGMYYTFYLCVFTGVLIVATQAWRFATGVALGSLVGLPHVITIIPSLLNASKRPPVSHSLDLVQQALVISGLHPVISVVPGHLIGAGYATVGIPTLAFAGLGIWIANNHGGFDRRWAFGVLGVAVIGALLATGFWAIYRIPGISIFRSAGRATDLIAFACLLLTVFAFRETEFTTYQSARRIGTTLLVACVITTMVAQPAFAGFAAQHPNEGRAVAQALDAQGCDEVWLEHVHTWGGKVRVRPAKASFAAVERGIVVQGGHYGDIGQSWTVTGPDGEPTFDALVVGKKPPETAHLTRPFEYEESTIVGQVNMSSFELVDTVPLEEDGAEAFIYAYEGRC